MSYSNSRLILVCAVWLSVGAVFFGGELVEEVEDEIVVEAGHDCTSPPCMYPAEPYDGGIMLGGADMTGEDLYTWGFETNNNVWEVPNRRGEDTRTLLVGLNQVDPINFFIYQEWRFDEPTTGDRETAYIHFWSADGDLTSGNTDCAGGDWSCDLFASVSEVQATELEGDAWSVTLSGEDYWVVQPEEDDDCSELLFQLCLRAGGDFDSDIEFQDGIFRGHAFSATNEYDGVNKVLRLGEVGNDNANVYAEIRHGTAHDRAHVLDGEVNDLWSNPHQDPMAAFTIPHTCEGNPESSADCTVDDDTGPTDYAYADIND